LVVLVFAGALKLQLLSTTTGSFLSGGGG